MILKPRPFRKPRKGHWASKGLVGLWLMNEGSGNTVQDLSGNGNVGTLTSGTWLGGKFGSCLDFAANTGYVNIPDFVEATTGITVITWVQSDVTNYAGTSYLISKYHTGGFGGWRLYLDGFEQLNFQVFTSGGNSTATSGTILSDNNWHMVVGTYDGANIRIYWDGVEVGSAAETGTITNRVEPIMIHGALTATSSSFDGRYDATSIYNRALSPSEIQQLYPEPFCMFDRDEIVLCQSGGAPPVGNAGIMTCNTGFWGA